MKKQKNILWIMGVMLTLAALTLSACGGGGGSANPGDTAPPSIPQNLTAEVISSSRIDLSWNASTDDAGVVGYKIYRNGSYYTGTTGTSYPATGLTESTHYCFAVTAHDAAGNESGMSNEVCRTTPAASDIEAPSVPAGVTATAESSSQIALSWYASTDNIGVAGYKVYRGGLFLKTVTTGTATTDTGLDPSTYYCYQVSAIDAAGNESGKSSQACATTQAASDTQAPTVPTGLSAVPISSSQISLSWDASTDNIGVAGYKVYRGGLFLKTVTTGTATTDTGLDPSTYYCYQVSAIDAAGNESGKSSQACATTEAPPPTSPAAPSNLTATAASSSSINLTWVDNSADETGFRLERSTSPTTGFALIATVGANVTNYTNTGLAASTTYYYRIRAYNSAGNSNYSNPANATTHSTPPAAPSSLVATAASSSSINLSWADNSGNETGFEIERSVSQTTGFAWIKTVNANVTSYTDTGLNASTTYYYRVRATNAVGPSDYSNMASATTPAAWIATTSTNPPDGRYDHTAVWTGVEMIVWGGWWSSGNTVSYFRSGGRYDPHTDIWVETTLTSAPSYRRDHTAVWTGSELIVWGGYDGSSRLRTGGRYNPDTNVWTSTTTTDAPLARGRHSAVWATYWMLVWGGNTLVGPVNTGGMYNPYYNQWAVMGTNGELPSARQDHAAIWTGSEMIIWGGWNGSTYFNTGGRYQFGTASWTATSTSSAPSARSGHTAVWTGSKMIVWGGWNGGSYFNTGGIYDPATNSWTAISTTNAPSARANHTAVWTGSKMIVWGGWNGSSYFNTGGIYDPVTNSWTAITTIGAPSSRNKHTSIWTGSKMIIWGGNGSTGQLNTGGIFLDGQ